MYLPMLMLIRRIIGAVFFDNWNHRIIHTHHPSLSVHHPRDCLAGESRPIVTLYPPWDYSVAEIHQSSQDAADSPER